MLDAISLYWFTNSAASSGRIYWGNRSATLAGLKLTLPVAVTVFPRDIPRLSDELDQLERDAIPEAHGQARPLAGLPHMRGDGALDTFRWPDDPTADGCALRGNYASQRVITGAEAGSARYWTRDQSTRVASDSFRRRHQLLQQHGLFEAGAPAEQESEGQSTKVIGFFVPRRWLTPETMDINGMVTEIEEIVRTKGLVAYDGQVITSLRRIGKREAAFEPTGIDIPEQIPERRHWAPNKLPSSASSSRTS